MALQGKISLKLSRTRIEKNDESRLEGILALKFLDIYF